MLRLRCTGALRVAALGLVPLIPASAIAVPAGADSAATAPQLSIVFSRTALSAADHSSGGDHGEYGTCVRDDRDIAPLDTVVAPFVAAN